jgi:pyruvate/2-oxoglutarate/acetoin dehydrogenase E1 component
MTTVLDSLNQGLHACLAASDSVWFLGEDVLDPYGGAFKVARGLSSVFPDRVLTTPVSEAGIVGVGVGMALRGLRPIVEIMFGDFTLLAADQLINHAAKLRWMSADRVHVPLVVRTPMGGRRGYGPTHSQTLEKHFLGAPGLRVVAATALDDPGGLLRTAVLEDEDPVLFVEHKLLYPLPVRPTAEEPEWDIRRGPGRYPPYFLTLSQAPEPTLTITAYGYMADLALQAARALAFEHEVFTELVVFTELSPFPVAELLESLSRTRRLLAVEEGTRSLGWGAEVLASAMESAVVPLRAARLAASDVPVPAAGTLEAAVLPGVERIVRAGLEVARGV